MKTSKKILIIYVVSLICIQIALAIIFIGISSVLKRDFISDGMRLLITNTVTYTTVGIFCFPYLKNIITIEYKRNDIMQILIYYIGMVAINIITKRIDFYFHVTSTSNQQSVEQTLFECIPLSIILIGIVIPIIEELVFRYALVDLFGKNRNFIAAILSSCIFGVVHLGNLSILEFMIYFVQGLYLCFVYMRTKNAFFSICVHCMYNTINLILIILTTTH